MKRPALLAQGIVAAVILLVSSAFALPVPERLIYEVSWRGIKAGSSVQEVTAQGDTLRIVNSIKSSGVVSTILSIDDRKESVIPVKSAQGAPGSPTFYREKISEGSSHKLREARFDHADLKVHYKDLLGKTSKYQAITPRTYDSLSSIYFVRSSELVPGQSICFEVYDFKRLWNTEVRVLKKEEIRTPLGTFRTVVVSSQLKQNGVTARAGNATVWLTDDSRRIPVRIKTTSKVGEITLTLVGGSYWR